MSNMKFTGFRQAVDDGVLSDLVYKDLGEAEIQLDAIEIQSVVSYLENGTPAFGFTLTLMDGDKIIGGYEFRTDGEWVWPSYFEYFLQKDEVKLMSKPFWEKIRLSNGKCPKIDETIFNMARREVLDLIN